MLRKEDFFFSFGLYQLLLLETCPRAGRALGASCRDPPGPGRAADVSLLAHTSAPLSSAWVPVLDSVLTLHLN